MSERFIKYIVCKKAAWLRENFPNAFLLLSLIAERARFEDDHLDGLLKGDALLGDYKAAGLTRKQYRNSLEKLEELKFIEIVAKKRHSGKVQKRAIKRAIRGTIVNLLDSEVWDINLENKGHQNGQLGAIKGPRTRMNKNEEDIDMNMKITTTSPSPSVPQIAVVDFFECLKNLPIPDEDKVLITKKFAGLEDRVKVAVQVAMQKPRDNLTGYILTVASKENVKVVPSKEEMPQKNKKLAEKKKQELAQKINGKNIFELYNKYCEIGAVGGATPPTAILYEQTTSSFREQLENAVRKILTVNI